MRRAEREVTEAAELMAIVEACPIVRIAMQDEAGLYLVPMNFGYSLEAGQLVLYLHSAREGRKARAFDRGAAVAFEMDCDYELLPGQTACQYGCRFRSVVGTGHIAPLSQTADKQQALAAIMAHLTGQAWAIGPEQTEAVQVYALTVTEMSGKAHR